ncbi:Bug family tripartite tricarboxylate transporter substrate binding protein [Pararhizobium antarcticum]|uniref:Tripartite tricarboxylate transporter substrate binding protein n=1 Tax=Pararhizobium antarcticum TaxID=1798805 RepID=A0A657LKM3_9HYPH|nr:tripartite tricarboxylate transporter substrate binding protein [Pararhizobium antarcticum]OJF90278.1 hypothetical protein AX760_24250 [Pararhizobium antarcticum]
MTIKSITRRQILAGATALATMLTLPNAGLAEEGYPERPVRFLIGFPPGGSADIAARVVAAELSKSLGQQFVVESKPGASGNIATQVVVGAPADGYTVYLAQIVLATNPHVMDVGYDPQKDLTMISQIVAVPVIMLTNPKSGLKTVQDVVTAAKEKNGELKFGGVLGTSSHLGPSLFALDQGFKFKLVPYKGGALALQALMSGEVDVVFDQMSGTMRGLLDGGNLTAVAVMQESQVKGLEKVPTANTQGVSPKGYFRSWMGLCVKAGTPQPIVDTLQKALLAALTKPEVRQRLEELGSEVVTSANPQEFQQFYLNEIERFGTLIKTIGYKPQ